MGLWLITVSCINSFVEILGNQVKSERSDWLKSFQMPWFREGFINDLGKIPAKGKYEILPVLYTLDSYAKAIIVVNLLLAETLKIFVRV